MQATPPSYILLQDKLQLINLIQRLLSNILQQTSTLPPIPSPFNCKSPPRIAIGQYLKRMAKYSHCSNSAYVMALILIDRYQERQQSFVINNYCIHRLLICSLMVAIKWIDDFYYKNEYYAKLGGITREQIDKLELEMIYLQKLQLYRDTSVRMES